MTTSIVSVPYIYGRANDKEIIVGKLLSETSSSSSSHIPVISVVGMGGIGKTTLAQLVYNDLIVMRTFKLRIWVNVSDPYDFQRVAKDIIIHAASRNTLPSAIGREALYQYLCDSVKGKRFLLVLDDVWNTDPTEWEPLRQALDGGAPDSRILVTTRNEEVAIIMGSIYVRHLGKLSENESLLLFTACAGLRGEAHQVPQDIVKRVAKQCDGVPLAIRTLGGLMRFKTDVQDWIEVLGSDIWWLPQIEESFVPSILLSYDTFSPNLKQCFSYCVIFPKNMVIYKDDMVKLWMAQGYLGSDGTRDLEIIGESYFDRLWMHSVFEDDKRDSDGKIVSCRMPNLVHDFLRSITRNECYSLTKMINTKVISTRIRHLTTKNMENPSIYSTKNLRTLLRPFDFQRATFTVPIKVVRQLACLRALDLSHSRFEELPRKVGKLLHLRYLDLSHTNLLKLPETVTDLLNLQTLKLNHCRRLQELPKGIGKLSNLRHLDIRRTEELRYLPQGIGTLCCLRTLTKFIVGGMSHGCNIQGLKDLNLIQGKLKIMGLGKVENTNKAAEAELKKKSSLRRLTLNFGYLTDGDVRKIEVILENLEPHENLQELKIKCYLGSKLPSWMLGSSMSNLITLELSKCEKCGPLPYLGDLPSLEKLTLTQMNMVKSISHSFYGVNVASGSTAENVAFPRLKILMFSGMLEWEDWELPISTERKIMPLLRVLTIKDCPKLKLLPPLGKLEFLEDLIICKLKSVKHIGDEFYGVGVDGGFGCEAIAFPKLRKFEVSDMGELDEWELPISTNKNIMPSLCVLALSDCPKMRSFPAFGKMKSLEILKINNFPSVERLGLEFLGITERVGCGESVEGVDIFPKLLELVITDMQELVEWNLPLLKDTKIMPYLRRLTIENCGKLKAMPFLGEFRTLDRLRLTVG